MLRGAITWSLRSFRSGSLSFAGAGREGSRFVLTDFDEKNFQLHTKMVSVL